MTREQIQALIDRVIGKKGILRAPSYWVSRLFGNLMDYADGKAKEGKAYTDDAVKNVKEYVDRKSYPKVNITAENLEMQPNTYYTFTGSNLALSLVEGATDMVSEYVIKIVCTGTPNIILPDGLVWANDTAPEFTEGATYQISIIDNLAVFAEFTSKS